MYQLTGSEGDRGRRQRKWMLIMAGWEEGNTSNNKKNVKKMSNILEEMC